MTSTADTAVAPGSEVRKAPTGNRDALGSDGGRADEATERAPAFGRRPLLRGGGVPPCATTRGCLETAAASRGARHTRGCEAELRGSAFPSGALVVIHKIWRVWVGWASGGLTVTNAGEGTNPRKSGEEIEIGACGGRRYRLAIVFCFRRWAEETEFVKGVTSCKHGWREN